MLRSLNEIRNYSFLAEDGEIGRCHDVLFDERHWVIRYMVADTGNWLPGKKVLVSPVALNEPDWAHRQIPTRLTREKIKGAPALTSNAGLTRAYEAEYHQYYGWYPYWGGTMAWGLFATPHGLAEHPEPFDWNSTQRDSDALLRSGNEVTGYKIDATDGDIGHVEDFVVEDGSWRIRYFVIDTRNWLPAKKVIVSPSWVEAISWEKQCVSMNLTQEKIKNSPEFVPSAPVNREYEARLYDYYGRPKYWEHDNPQHF